MATTQQPNNSQWVLHPMRWPICWMFYACLSACLMVHYLFTGEDMQMKCNWHFAPMHSFNHHSNPVRKVRLLFPFYKLGNQGLGMMNNLLTVIGEQRWCLAHKRHSKYWWSEAENCTQALQPRAQAHNHFAVLPPAQWKSPKGGVIVSSLSAWLLVLLK